VLVRRIVADGHEVASHGYDHTRIHHFTPERFRADVTRTKKILEDITGVPVRGYRAPSYSINGRNLWALDVLAETGHVYSSSIYPIPPIWRHAEAPRFPFRSAKEFSNSRNDDRWAFNFPCGAVATSGCSVCCVSLDARGVNVDRQRAVLFPSREVAQPG
jgi:peptidoglycan/xylan/chitin deacetylase (PgdA/CDA1 family)